MTETASLPDRIHDASDYLAVLQALTQAVDRGIAALATNQLRTFQEHLTAQEDCCSLLAAIDFGASGSRVADLCGTHDNDPQLRTLVDTEHRRLGSLTRLYKALLRRSVRSVDLLALHCQTYLPTCDFAGQVRSECEGLFAEG
jgi:hypothetical protein